MSSSDFTQRRRQEHQVQAAARAEDVQRGSHGHGKEEPETADEMLDQLLEDMKTPGKEQGDKSGTRQPDSTRRSSTEREVGEGATALTSAGEREALCKSWRSKLERAKKRPRIQRHWKKSRDQCRCHLKNLLDLKRYEEEGMVDCYLG